MDRDHSLLQPGYLLHQRAYGDSSAIVEVFSRDHGRIGLMAKGVRGGKSRRQGLLQPFGPLLLSWRGRGDLPLLTDVEASAPPPILAGTRLISGFYLNELLMRLLRREDPHPELFDDYREALVALATPGPEARLLRVFEKRLLQHLGYGLILSHDVQGQAVEADGWYRYAPDEGPARLASVESGAISGRTLLALETEDGAGLEGDLDAKRVLRAALAPHLGPRPLRSRELYRQFSKTNRQEGEA